MKCSSRRNCDLLFSIHPFLRCIKMRLSPILTFIVVGRQIPFGGCYSSHVSAAAYWGFAVPSPGAVVPIWAAFTRADNNRVGEGKGSDLPSAACPW